MATVVADDNRLVAGGSGASGDSASGELTVQTTVVMTVMKVGDRDVSADDDSTWSRALTVV